MKNTKVEVEGGELLLKSKEGHYAVIPAKDRQKLMGMVKDNCDDCINSYIQTLPKEANYAQDGSLFPGWDTIKANLNPKNWGVKDYTDRGEFDSAYNSAKKAGEKEFMWNNKRYNTNYGGTPRQEVGSYGVDGKPIDEKDYPVQVNVYKPGSKYLPGHIEAQLTDYLGQNPSINYSSGGNYSTGISTRKEKRKNTYNVYGNVDKDEFENKSESLPAGKFSDSLGLEEEPSDWNLFTNNCADNVCDAFGIPRRKGIETPGNTLDKIQNKYPTLDVTGRTYEDYKKLSTSLMVEGEYINEKNQLAFKYELKKEPDEILEQSKNLVGIISSPEFKNTEVRRHITAALQKSLIQSGYDLPKSVQEDGSLDGVLGEETKKALLDYQSKNKKK